jgi:hypothetical protein
VVREFCGHGIGARFHEEPQVLHYGRPGTLEELKPGMTFTIEPMINAGRDIKEIKEMGDGWTIVTKDHSPVRAVGAHGAGHRDGLRGADAVGRQPAAAGLRTAAATPVLVPCRGAPAWHDPERCARGRPRPQARRALRTDRVAGRRRLPRAAAPAAAGPGGALADEARWPSCGRTPGCRRALRWWPWAVTGAASCSRTPTWTCCCCMPDGARRPDEPRAQAAHRGLHRQLLGLGLEIGSSVRTLSECVAEAEKDVTVQTAMLESRLVGRRKLYTAS